MSSPALSSRRFRLSWKRMVKILAVVVPLVVIGLPVVLGFGMTYGLLYAPCSDNGLTPEHFGYTASEWTSLTLDAQAGGRFRAFFIEGNNHAAIIIPPPYAGGRGSRLHEADVLARNGYAVLVYESRRCAEMGPLSLGYKEVDEVGDALAYLQAHDGVDSDRIGILGFSSAGATAVMATARYPAIGALVAEGGYGDLAEISVDGPSQNFLESLYKWSMRASYHLLTGVSIDKLSPTDVIGSIAPRPILLIYGSTETSLEGARKQRAAAGDHAELWVVQGAGHGNYLEVAGDEYEKRVVEFFNTALLDSQ